MKKNFLLLSSLLLFAFTTVDAPLSQQEREFATKFLNETKQGVYDAVKGLSEAQLTYKPAPDKWSVEECVKHIAISETNLWDMTTSLIKQPANAEKRADITATDEQLIKGTEDRTNKVKTYDALKPENTPFHSVDEALQSFSDNRDQHIDYVNSTQEDLRDHVTKLPMGTFDAYQLILLLSAHTNRHTQQIMEVKTDPGFPKN